MRRTGAVGRTAALALCVVAMLRHMHVVTAVGTQLGSVQFPMLDPLRDDERQPPPDLSPFLAKEPDEVPPAPPEGLRDFSQETMARMHPKLQRMIERERTMAAFAERYSNAPQPPPPPPPPDNLMNFAAPLHKRVNAGVSQEDVYRLGYQSTLRRARAAKAGATDVPEDRPQPRRAKDWSEVLKEQFEVQENRLEALRSAPPSPDAGEWVDGVYHSHTGLNPENNATDNTYKTATLTAQPREKVLKDWALGRHNAPLPTTFVTFLPIDPAAGLPEDHTGRAAAYQRVLYAFKTACKLHPNARIVVLTDYTTRHSDLRFLQPYSTGFLGSNGVRLPCAVTINPPPPPPPDADPTLERPASAAAAARRREGGRVQLLEEARYLEGLATQVDKHHVVFFDVKHLFVDTLDRLFDNHFDVGFVFHNSDGPGLDAPLNLHMKFVHGGKANFRGAARLWRDAAAAMPEDCRRVSREEGGGACDDAALRRVLTDFIPNLEQQREQREQRGENATADEPVTYLYAPIGRTPMDVRLVPCSLYSAVPGGSFMGSCRPSRLTKALRIMGAEAKSRMNELFKDVWHGRGDVAVQKAVEASEPPKEPKAKSKSHG